jgi:hypothetical protein
MRSMAQSPNSVIYIVEILEKPTAHPYPSCSQVN